MYTTTVVVMLFFKTTKKQVQLLVDRARAELRPLCCRTSTLTAQQIIIIINNNNNLGGSTSTKRFFIYLYVIPVRIGIWKCLCLTREKNRSARRKNLSEQRREPTTNSTHIMASMLGFEPGPHWWEVSALTTAPSLAPHAAS